MTQVHDVLYPPRDQDTRVSHRRYDAKERLIAWSVRQDDHHLLFRVTAFREVTRENGNKLDVPETIECRYSQTDVEPDAAFAEMVVTYTYENGVAADYSTSGPYTFTGREFDTETGLQFNKARHFDPTPGRWLDGSPLGYEPGDGNLYRYPDMTKAPDSTPTDVPEDGR